MPRHGVTEFLNVFQDIGATFFEISPDLHIVLDESGNILRVNPAFEKNLNRSEIDVLGRGIIRYIHQDDLAKFMHSFDYADDSEKSPLFRLAKFEHGFITVRRVASKFRSTSDGQRGYLILRIIYNTDERLDWQRKMNWSK